MYEFEPKDYERIINRIANLIIDAGYLDVRVAEQEIHHEFVLH